MTLTLTPNATTEIRQLVDAPTTPDGCGVRIATDPAGAGLSLSLAATPAEDDHVIDDAGARVFLEPHAAELLEDQTLDAQVDEAGQLRFTVGRTG
jgi:Fe-S cluster assembly iron-binding protein IscA